MILPAEDALVSSEWLARHLNAPDVRVVDASWYLPGEGRDAAQDFVHAHIPGAVYFDIDEICDTDTDLPHMLPSPIKFSARARKLGLGDGNRIVVYDSGTGLAAPRVWWMFRAFGHDEVSVLDGGFKTWRAKDRPVDDAPTLPRERHFTARLDTTLVRDFDQMRANLESRAEQVVDARSPARFTGAEPEPRPGLHSGAIPGSLNLPFSRLLAEDGSFLPAPALAEVFEAAGVDLSRPIVTTCGSGVSAAVLFLGLHLLGCPRIALYDGSWSEWGAHQETPDHDR